MDSLNIANSGDDCEEERLIEEIIQLIDICPPDNKMTFFEEIFLSEAYQKLRSKKDDIKKRVFTDD